MNFNRQTPTHVWIAFMQASRIGLLGSLAFAFSGLSLSTASAQHAMPQHSVLSELGSSAQEEGFPPELSLPGDLPAPSSRAKPFLENESILSDMELHDPREVMELDEEANLISSGTWFRRGYWFVEEKVAILTLDLGKNLAVAVDTPAGIPGRVLVVKGTAGGVSANAGLTLGRFLYRDSKNRDHTVEFSFLGLGKWSAEGMIRSEQGDDTLFTVLSTQLPLGAVFAPGFNFTARQEFQYVSRMNDFEWNYRMRRRLRPDWLVLDEHGQWNREMDPGMLLGFLFGVRWFELSEKFDYSAEAVDPTRVNGQLNVKTRNNLIGFQFGGEANYQHKRWSIALEGKAGPYLNFSRSQLDYRAHDENVDPVNPDFEAHRRGAFDTIAFIGEVGIHAKYYAKPNLSFQVGWDALWVDSLALATRQVQFVEAQAIRSVNPSSGAQYMGFSVGMDYHW